MSTRLKSSDALTIICLILTKYLVVAMDEAMTYDNDSDFEDKNDYFDPDEQSKNCESHSTYVHTFR